MAREVESISNSGQSVSVVDKNSLLDTMNTLLTDMQVPAIGMCISPLVYEDLFIEYFRIVQAIRALVVSK